MPVTVKFVGALRHISGKTQLRIECGSGGTLKDLILQITREMPKLNGSLLDQQNGESKSNALILVNGKEISVLDGLETKLKDRDEVVFIPVVHGG
jgi:molybdopterin synthase sulfur carrier subunit